MSEGAGSYDVSGRGRVSVCRPLQAPWRKAREAKRRESAQPLAQSTRRVFLLVQISMGLLVQILMGKLPEQPRVGIPSMSAGSGDGEAKSEVEESLPVLRWRLYAGQGFDLTG